MKYVADLITRVREHTLNTGNTATSGILDSHFLNYLNDAQDRLVSLIHQTGSNLFETQTEISLVGAQRTYSIPVAAVLKNRVKLVEISSTGNVKDYVPLRKESFRQLINDQIDFPVSYSLVNGSIYLSPVPQTSTGKIRVTYTRRLDALDIRRGSVASKTDSGTQITALTLNTSDDDTTALAASTYLCVCDRDGAVTMYNLRYDSYNSTTGVVTLTGAAFTYATGETIAVGDFVTTQPYSTTHSDLDDLAERYLVKYAVMEILSIEDSSADFAQAQQILNAMEQELVAAYHPDGDDFLAPLIFDSFFR